jgi:hypothetical protein
MPLQLLQNCVFPASTAACAVLCNPFVLLYMTGAQMLCMLWQVLLQF